MSLIRNCPICLKYNKPIHTSRTKLGGVRKSKIGFSYCHKCSHGYLSQTPSEEDMRKFYASFVGEEKELMKWTEKNKRIRKTQMEELREIVNKNDHILEVGCSTGYNVETLKSYGFKNVEGIDLDEGAIKYGKEYITEHISLNSFEKLNKRYDVIIMVHVLEHIANYNEMIDDMISKLNPGGKIFIWVPDSHRKREIPAHYHYHYFSDKSISKLRNVKSISVINESPVLNIPNIRVEITKERPKDIEWHIEERRWNFTRKQNKFWKSILDCKKN